ncbi:hypothetical protein CEXT_513071 [Caerostris extrusa]|uniref:Uncharacterized protein n=1 Tax=Caerostris extrusa TaxID=172846 RepID=A0AAV4PLS4_CAEEX|nr:hypothetical protein CEXT_513071 [Caerostris extrusa]
MFEWSVNKGWSHIKGWIMILPGIPSKCRGRRSKIVSRSHIWVFRAQTVDGIEGLMEFGVNETSGLNTEKLDISICVHVRRKVVTMSSNERLKFLL